MNAALLLLLLQAPADTDFERGLALARAERWAEARRAFEAGRKKAPRDKRFSTELAGIAFKQRQYEAAKSSLRQVLRLDGADAYANDFLATLFLLDGNVEAALKYWNRTGKPQLEQVRVEPEPRLDPVLLDRAFAFSPASMLRLRDYEATQARLRVLDAFSRWRFELAPRAEDRFDLNLQVAESRPWWSLLQGLPFSSVQPRFRDLDGAGTNIAAIVRWDPNKRRAWLELSRPLARDPAWRYRLFFDGRDENWNTSRTGDFKLRKIEAGAGVRTAAGWWSELAFSERHFRRVPFAAGAALRLATGLDRRLLSNPERRLTLDASGAWELGRLFAASGGVFAKAGLGLEAHWLPRARGEDWETTARLRTGEAAGALPFDELFILGLERDNDLWLRAHIGTVAGKKGSAPMGRRYLLFNWDTYKTIYDAGFLAIQFGPFLDSGRVGDHAGGFGAAKWLWDTGLQLKARLPGGVGFVLSWGKDLRSGGNSFYLRTTP